MNNSFIVKPYDASLRKLASLFDCGSSPVYNSFLRSADALDPAFGKTYVFLTEDSAAIIGYYNIGVGDVEYSDGYQALKCGGSIHINFLALDKRFRGRLAFSDDSGRDLLVRHAAARLPFESAEDPGGIRRIHVCYADSLTGGL